jgi:hypothetical protein
VRSLLVVLAALASGAARADPPPAGGVTDLIGPRALALAAATGVASGNDGIFVNPAAVAARRRYSVEPLFATDRRGGTTVGQYLGASVVDSLSAPMTASLAYVRPVDGAERGNLLVGGLAGAVMEKLYLGVQARYLGLERTTATGTEKIGGVTADAGLFWEVGDLVSLGVSGYNLVPIGHRRWVPRSVGAGLAVGSDTSFRVMADWHADLDRDPNGKTTNRYAAGAEVLLGNMAPVRAGLERDETLGTSWWSLGAGLVTPTGAALDVGYKQSFTSPNARIIAVSFKLQFLEL